MLSNEDLDALVEKFDRMKADGVATPILKAHKPPDGQTMSDITLGRITDLVRGGTAKATRLLERRQAERQEPLNTNALYGVFSFPDDDAERMANRVGLVSIQIHPNLSDSRGGFYGRAIEHIALTPQPVIPAQTQFEKLAFDTVFSLSRDCDGRLLVKAESTQEPLSMALKHEHLTAIKAALVKHLGADHEDVKGLDEDNAVPTVCKHLALCAGKTGLSLSMETLKDLDLVSLDGTTEGAIKGWVTRRGGSGSFKADHATNYAEATGASASNDKEHGLAAHLHEHAAHLHEEAAKHAKSPDQKAYHEAAAKHHHSEADSHAKHGQEYLTKSSQKFTPYLHKLAASRELPAQYRGMVTGAAKVQLSSLCARGCITPKVRDGLSKLLIGTAEEPNTLALSCDEGSETNLVAQVAAVLADNTPVALGEHTKGQRTSLSREVPDENPAKQSKAVTEQMTRMANGEK